MAFRAWRTPSLGFEAFWRNKSFWRLRPHVFDQENEEGSISSTSSFFVELWQELWSDRNWTMNNSKTWHQQHVPEIGKVLLPGQIGSSVFGTCCAGNACWMGLTLIINSGIQRTGVWLSHIDCNTCPCCTVVFASLDAKQKFATLETEKGIVFSSGKDKSQDFCTNLRCRLHAFWFETQVGCNKNFSRRHLHRCRALAELL